MLRELCEKPIFLVIVRFDLFLTPIINRNEFPNGC
jgi:hypothetical protein